ncbi:hypothetical protein [Halocynthiibacter sp.]|uniref:hypothetical protein n=1 Tax=Halocynthiibacter sp. TaxID=1979210 RepID=UPI003C6F61A1
MALLSAACSGPGVRMMGVSGQEVTVEGSLFTVYIKGNAAEAVRTSFEFPARISTVFPRARIAIEQVSGCRIPDGNLHGDAALIRARIVC